MAVCDFAPPPSQVNHCQFWEEWVGLGEELSGYLCDLFNSLPAVYMYPEGHSTPPMIASGHRLSPEEVRREMESR